MVKFLGILTPSPFVATKLNKAYVIKNSHLTNLLSLNCQRCLWMTPLKLFCKKKSVLLVQTMGGIFCGMSKMWQKLDVFDILTGEVGRVRKVF